ncbi:hypothetical protein CspeluHIS016_0203350 [Cutaneotrichosporon spelunceum]|uniref:CBS domain-containing protein n=1 Tax=Cutaneotrichosporon spelunceum TaxID=1672016 RepID=A0AAD3TRE5_9TREE|nr:hypothetical protein CspeluHIS016_0203350 [Cutaneotrichosporon spelunceum]
MSRIPVPNGGLQSTPGSPGMSSTPASEPRRKTNRRDETFPSSPLPQNASLPMSPLDNNLFFDGGRTTQKPLDTPPSSFHSTSPKTLLEPLPDRPRRTSQHLDNVDLGLPSSKPNPNAVYSGLPNDVDKPRRRKNTMPMPPPPSDEQRLAESLESPQNPTKYYSNLSRADVTSSGKLVRGSPVRQMSFKFQSLRKKIENELSRKRPGGGRSQQDGTPSSLKRQSKRNLKGTVAGLRPSPALTVPEGMSVADAAQLCAAKRTDCVLVVDDEEGLSGIFTAKDLAFRVTAEGLDPRLTAVSSIMTRNPMVTRDSTSATEALQLMVSRHFRHLPVCNDDGDVVGLLDITKVFHDALAKVERSSSATNQLSAALAGVQNELGPGLNNPQAAAMLAYVDALRDKMAQPDLMSVLDTSLPPPTVTPRTSVREAARLMKDRRTTAVCVLETNSGTSNLSGVSTPGAPPKIAGIFTSKDIVLRVIAAGLDASRCSVVRVMTPHPDTAPPHMIVQDALKKMHSGHYLNLPVVTEDEGRLVGIVDVLKLTYATLEQIESMNEETGSESGGPMWSKFFDTLNQGAPEDDSVSAVSRHSSADTPSKLHHQRHLSVTSPISEVMPGDSASAINENISDIGLRQGPASSVAPPALPDDDGTYVFKFKTPSGRTHRFQARHDSYDLLRDIVLGKLQVDPFFEPSSDSNAFVPDATCFVLSYNDDEGDLVDITADADVADAVRVARGQKSSRVVLSVHGGKNWEEAVRANAAAAAAAEEAGEEAKPVAVPEKKIQTIPELPEVSVSDPAETLKDPHADPAHVPTYGATGVHARNIVEPNELIFGVLPKDMALPAAIGFLGVVIAGVFIASRTSK